MVTVEYVNNKEMYEVLCEYLDACNEAEKRGEELPRVPEYIGACFVKIADNFGNRAQFSGYPFLSDMKSDGIINCVKYIRNFNPNYTKNPFAYFTEYIKNAFILRIEIEKGHLYNRYRSYNDLQVMEQINGAEGACYEELNEISNDFINSYEKRQADKKARAKQRALERANTVASLFESD